VETRGPEAANRPSNVRTYQKLNGRHQTLAAYTHDASYGESNAAEATKGDD